MAESHSVYNRHQFRAMRRISRARFMSPAQKSRAVQRLLGFNPIEARDALANFDLAVAHRAEAAALEHAARIEAFRRSERRVAERAAQ